MLRHNQFDVQRAEPEEGDSHGKLILVQKDDGPEVPEELDVKYVSSSDIVKAIRKYNWDNR